MLPLSDTIWYNEDSGIKIERSVVYARFLINEMFHAKCLHIFTYLQHLRVIRNKFIKINEPKSAVFKY
jgi:hypothetical protein